MSNPNEEIVKRYFEAYSQHDLDAIRQVMSENVSWHFPGNHPFAGTKKGIEGVVALFDAMAAIMKESNPKMEKLITAANDRYFIECQHSSTNRTDGNNLDHYSSVLWTIENGKIIEGRHFFADQQAVDRYFSIVGSK